MPPTSGSRSAHSLRTGRRAKVEIAAVQNCTRHFDWILMIGDL
jgi:hypothetical protein